MFSFKPCWPLAAVFPALLLTSALAGCDRQPQSQPAAQEQGQPRPVFVNRDGKMVPAEPPQEGAAPALQKDEQLASVPQKAAQPASAPEPWKPSTPDETAVQQRAKERWDALVVRDFDRAWVYLEPAVREKVKQGDYKKQFGNVGKLEGADVYRVVCGKTRCAARIRLVSKVQVPGFERTSPVTTYFDEEWRKEGDQWWYRGVAGAHRSEPGEEPLPSAADPLPPAVRPASGPAWGP